MTAVIRALRGSRPASTLAEQDRELLRAIRTNNRCLDAQCVDLLGENCICHADFLAAKDDGGTEV